jgi:hypothetical protein
MSLSSAALPDGARRSHALEAFSTRLAGAEGLQVLDFGPASQANIDFVTSLNHRIYSDDILDTVRSFFTPAELAAQEFPGARIESFIDQTIGFPDQTTDGALVWDSIQFLPAPLVQPVIDRLFRVLAPESLLLATFLPENAPREATPLHCRILDARTLLARPRSFRLPIVPLSNRSIERIFQRFSSVRFFLTRDNFREILVRR